MTDAEQAERIKPQPGPQMAFLRTPADVAVYGGAAGGGKTFALLLEAARNVGNPRYGGLIFRRTYPQIFAEGGLWDEASNLYPKVGATPVGTEFRFPSGASVRFSHLQHENNRFDFQGAQIPFIGFDEGTHFTWKQFTYLLGRNRSTCGVPPYIRITCNPDPDHWLREFLDWWIDEDGYPIPKRCGVLRWFTVQGNEVVWGDSKEELLQRYGEDCMPLSATFIAAGLADNPALLQKDPGYRAKLQALPRVERQRLEFGNWDVRESAGELLPRTSIGVLPAAPAKIKRMVRAWDLAATAKGGDWTVGLLMGLDDEGFAYVLDVVRGQWSEHEVREVIKRTAEQDGKRVRVRLPEDPGQAGKGQASTMVRMLKGYDVVARRMTGSKLTRARPLIAQVQAGNVYLVEGGWNNALLREWDAWSATDGETDDQVDAGADAYDELVNHTQSRPRVRVA